MDFSSEAWPGRQPTGVQPAGKSTASLTLLEAKTVLVKVYDVPPPLATRKLRQVAAGPLAVAPIDREVAESALHTADRERLDLFDAVLLECCRRLGVRRLASDDRKPALACRKAGIRRRTRWTGGCAGRWQAGRRLTFPLRACPVCCERFTDGWAPAIRTRRATFGHTRAWGAGCRKRNSRTTRLNSAAWTRWMLCRPSGSENHRLKAVAVVTD